MLHCVSEAGCTIIMAEMYHLKRYRLSSIRTDDGIDWNYYCLRVCYQSGGRGGEIHVRKGLPSLMLIRRLEISCIRIGKEINKVDSMYLCASLSKPSFKFEYIKFTSTGINVVDMVHASSQINTDCYLIQVSI